MFRPDNLRFSVCWKDRQLWNPFRWFPQCGQISDPSEDCQASHRDYEYWLTPAHSHKPADCPHTPWFPDKTLLYFLFYLLFLQSFFFHPYSSLSSAHTVFMMKNFVKSFLKCGITGWCLEIIYTALGSLRRRRFSLKGTTSLWMFPIYGSACLLTPLFRLLKNFPAYVRGSIYAVCIFTAEYLSGRFLTKRELCPWSYENCRWRIRDVIRLDFFPNWFFTGLLFEKLLSSKRNDP